MTDRETEDDDMPVELPINGMLDLHTFNPREVRNLLPHYIASCRQKGIFEIRIIHGKGTGMLRETIHSILGKMPGIASFKLAGEDGGGWGVTIVVLENIK